MEKVEEGIKKGRTRERELQGDLTTLEVRKRRLENERGPQEEVAALESKIAEKNSSLSQLQERQNQQCRIERKLTEKMSNRKKTNRKKINLTEEGLQKGYRLLTVSTVAIVLSFIFGLYLRHSNQFT